MGLGPELVANGGFADETVWVEGIGWGITGGVASNSTNDSDLYQSISISSGKKYRISVLLIANGGGASISWDIGGQGIDLVYFFAPDSSEKTKDVVASGDDTNITFHRESGDISIDNVSVKEILGGLAIPGPEFMDEMEDW